MAMMKQLTAILGVYTLLTNVHGAEWGYEGDIGPAYWKNEFPACGHENQSPIDIDHSIEVYDPELGEITFEGYGTAPTGMTLKNTGHGVQVDIDGDTMHMSDSKLPGTFRLAQFHFHWADTNSGGAEHHYDGHLHPMELHLVHWNTKYQNIEDALDKIDGLAVLGVFVEVEEGDHDGFAEFVDKLSEIAYPGDNVALTPFAVDKLIPAPAERGDYFRYIGSLTTPPCHESVTWTVLENRITISQAQMDAFRTGLFEVIGNNTRRIKDNYRPAQPLNDRTIYSSHELPNDDPVPGGDDPVLTTTPQAGGAAKQVPLVIVPVITFLLTIFHLFN